MNKLKLQGKNLMAALFLTIFSFGICEVSANDGGFDFKWVECELKDVAVKRCIMGSGTCQASDQRFCDEIIVPGDESIN